MHTAHRNDVRRALATIAYAEVPPPGHGYLLRTNVPRPASAVAACRRSPYANTLAFHVDYPSRDLYVWPTSTRTMPSEAHRKALPANDRPDPARLPLTAQRYPEEPPPDPATTAKNAAYIKTEAAYPSGRTFRFPQRGTGTISYYRERFPKATFHSRRGFIYATFPGKAAPRLPNSAYRDLPDDGRTGPSRPRDAVPEPGTAHVYVNAVCRTRATPNGRTLHRDLNTPSLRYYTAPLPDLTTPDHQRFLNTYGQEVQIHPDAALPTAPLAPGRYEPLPIYRQDGQGGGAYEHGPDTQHYYDRVQQERAEAQKERVDNPPGQA